MKPCVFTGSAVAIVTPFCGDGVDLEAFDRLIERQIQGGTDAIVVCGTTGEAATLSYNERMALIERCVRIVDHRVPVIAGSGTNSTASSIALSKAAQSAGVDALLTVTPYYNKASQSGLVQHFSAIADAVDIPVILYNVPSRTGVNIQPATLEKICRLPQVVAVKEANPDVAQAMEKINLVGDNATFYCGNDDLTIPLMVLGFQGVISVLSNVMPAETSKMTSLALSGNWAEASKMQRDLLPMVKALVCETSPIPCKAAMSMMGMCRNELRLPLIPMQEANQQKLADIMRGWKLI